jgi:hypothetical protein
MALLTAGQFDHAYKELMKWMKSVSATLDELEPVYGDPKMVEIELAKLRVSVSLCRGPETNWLHDTDRR